MELSSLYCSTQSRKLSCLILDIALSSSLLLSRSQYYYKYQEGGLGKLPACAVRGGHTWRHLGGLGTGPQQEGLSPEPVTLQVPADLLPANVSTFNAFAIHRAMEVEKDQVITSVDGDR